MGIGEEQEVAPGLVVERRCAMATFAAILAAAASPAWPAALVGEAARQKLTFDEFLAEVVPTAKRLVADTSLDGQNRYLRHVAALAVRLSDVPQPEMRDSGQGAGPGTFIGFNPGGDPFTVLHWRMEPFTEIRTHAHTYGNVVTLVLAGEAEVVNYEVEGKPDYSATDPFVVRRTLREALQPGGINLVNLKRNYIHGFRAGAHGARGLDITTRIAPRAPTPYLVVEDRNSVLSPANWHFDEPQS